MQKRLFYFIICILGLIPAVAFAQNADSTKSKSGYFYSWADVYLNRFNYTTSPPLTLFPAQLGTSVLFNPAYSNFSISEKVGKDIDAKFPEALTFEKYSSIQNTMLRKSIIRDIERAQDGYTDYSGTRNKPLLEANKIFDRIFGDKLPEFKPNGFIQVMASHHRRKTDDPMVPIYSRDRSYFDFDQQISINFNNLFSHQTSSQMGGGGYGAGMGGGFGGNDGFGGGYGNNDRLNTSSNTSIPSLGRIQNISNVVTRPGQIKEKVNMIGNFDTKSPFIFDNRLKINFKNEPEDILQVVELGNISFPNRSQLIPGIENLLGAKVGLKFGKLDITGVVAQQNSRTKSIVLSGGGQNRSFEIRADNYEENRHFFLSQFFRENYERSLRSLPVVTSGVIITRVEAYVTNRNYSVETNRNILGLSDLGEGTPYNQNLTANQLPQNLADNTVNSLYNDVLVNTAFSRQIDQVVSAISGLNMNMGQDYELLRGAKKLDQNDFDLNPQLGYISLRTPLRNDEVLAVSFEYTYRGKKYKVGELTEDYLDKTESDAIVLKLIKSGSIRNNLKNPMWDLMMKNVYNLGQGRLEPDGFQLRIIYKDDQTGMSVPFLADVAGIHDIPLLGLLGLDRLNYNNEIIGDGKRGGDGNFDFIEGITVDPQQGRIIFPVLEPFGSYLEEQLNTHPDISGDIRARAVNKYVFNDIYKKTLSDAQQNTLKNKYYIEGTFVTSSNDINLPLGASTSSVRVYSGGIELKPGTDFMIDNQLGTIRLTNPSLVNSGRPIRIDYEETDMFQTQIRRMLGLRMDYTLSRNLRIGGTLQSLKENTPGFTTRTNIGNEPVNNTVWGLDLNYQKTGMGLTRLLDALPGVQTKEPSTALISAEFAQLIPGVNTKRVNNSSMIDDFEYARSTNDLARQPARWRLGSTPPQFQTEINDFYNDQKISSHQYHYRRAKMSVYNVDMTTYFSGSSGGFGEIPAFLSQQAQRNVYTAGFNIQDILVGRSMPTFAEQVPTNLLDISYFPTEPGMYNYNPDLNPDGSLSGDPTKNFGSVMRGITFDADFDNSNIEYLEFWMMNPFEDEIPLSTPIKNEKGGKILIQLGDVSEDVIPDGRYNFENGILPDELSGGATKNPYVTTLWGRAPDVQFMVDAFQNDPEIRKIQDVGLDGLSNEMEREHINPNNPEEGIKPFLDKIKPKLNPEAFDKVYEDPSKDDFRHFLDPSFSENTPLLERFKDYLGMEDNSPYNNEKTASQVVYANSNMADKEDINQDNTINELEDFFEYEIDIRPDAGRGIKNNRYIVDQVEVAARAGRPASTWYLFRVPIKNYSRKYPSTKDDSFKSIRFMRLVTTDWEEPVVFRFATMQLVANQYRKYQYKINDPNEDEFYETPLDTLTDRTILNSSTVSIEENGCPKGVDCGDTKPYPYAVPPGFVRDVNYANQARMEFNEQSMSLTVENLEAGDSRGVFKNIDLDLNMYKRIKMFVHMHSEQIGVDSVGMFLRLGTDLKNNYYEIEIPRLARTSPGEISPTRIWPEQNEIDIPLELLRSLKIKRNQTATRENFSDEYSEHVTVEGTISGSEAPIFRNYRIAVKGNPNFSQLKVLMIGVRNNDKEERDYTVWTNELRTHGFDDQDKGSAGIVSVDLNLADLGTLMLAGSFRNFGFGTVQDKISGRSQEDSYSFGGSLNLDLDKFFPMNWGLSIPFYANYDRQVATPGFNPLDPDIRLNRSLEGNNRNPFQENLTQDMVSDISTTSGFSFMNVRKNRTNDKNRIYDIENFSFSYAQNTIYRNNVLMAHNDQSIKNAGLTYQFSPRVQALEPFKNVASLDSSIIGFIKPFSLNLVPSVISLKAYNEQVFYRTLFRDINLQNLSNENLIKYYYGNRYYDMQWNLTQNITVNYNSHMQAIMDDVDGAPSAEQDIKFGQRLFSLGRAKNYTQGLKAAWRLPLQDIYLLDWINANATYDNNFDFRGVAFGQYHEVGGERYEYGNIIENGRRFGLDGKVDLVKLYNKIGFLRKANQDSPPRRKYTRAPGDEIDMEFESNRFTKAVTRLLMSARGINGRFALTESTLMPGFLGTPKIFGMDGNQPGLGFVLGSQKEKYIIETADNGFLSRNIQQYNPIIQQRGYTFEYSTNFEPFKGFRMVIRGNMAKDNDISYVYQPSENREDPSYMGDFQHFAPVRGGSFKMSFWSFRTSFKKINTDPWSGYDYEPFNNLVKYRDEVLAREEFKGSKLEKNSQDVLIPAFFAAYTGRSVDDVFEKKKYRRNGSNTFNPFLGLPMPNWMINYQGLEKLSGFRALFSSITLSHSFVSSYSVGNYTSSLMYDYRAWEMLNFRGSQGNGYFLGTETNPYNNLFDPVFIMSSIVMEEKFAPFLGINFTTKGNFTGNFSWNKDRIALLNLSNAQVAETHGNDFIFGFGFKKNNITLPLRGRDGNQIVLPNDLIMRIDFSLRDMIILQRKLDGDAMVKNGGRNLQISPTVQYQFNKQVSMSVFWKKIVNNPYVTQTPYMSNAEFGVTARFNLTD